MIVLFFLAGSAVIFMLITAILLYTVLHQKKIVQLRMQLHEEDLQRQQNIYDALQEGQEQERTRLAQELHDGVGAKLSGLKMTLEYLKTNTSQNAALIETVFSELSETLEEVREISHNLQPYFIHNSIEQLLSNLMEQLSTAGTCTYDLAVEMSGSEMTDTVKLHVYRIIAELLNNIHKHAMASKASVQINTEQDRMEIVVEDNGIGLYNATSNSEGIGLKNIKHRISICKGTMNIDSSGGGTTVIIEIPLNHVS